MITAGAASEKISELRSKLAIHMAWAELIEANYLPADAGEAEAFISRSDGGRVSEAHFRSFLEDAEQRCVELRDELAEWEGLVFQPKARAEGEVHELKPQLPKQRVVERNKTSGRRLQTPQTAPGPK